MRDWILRSLCWEGIALVSWLKQKRSMEDIIMDAVILVLLVIIIFLTLYPFYYALIISFNSGVDASRGGVYFWPRLFTLDNYAQVFQDKAWINAFMISVARTAVGTLCSLIFTGLFAYGLSFQDLMFRKVYMSALLFSMYFSGGLIPFFVLLRGLGLLNTFFVYVVPVLLDTFMTLVMISFFRELPRSLQESAKIDGGNDLVIFFKIILPASMPVIATAALFMGVAQWNNWFDATFFVQNKDLKPLAFLLKEIINKAQITSMQGEASAQALSMRSMSSYTPASLQMASMIVAITPIIFIYPFAQKYFVKGVLLGAVKE